MGQLLMWERGSNFLRMCLCDHLYWSVIGSIRERLWGKRGVKSTGELSVMCMDACHFTGVMGKGIAI